MFTTPDHARSGYNNIQCSSTVSSSSKTSTSARTSLSPVPFRSPPASNGPSTIALHPAPTSFKSIRQSAPPFSELFIPARTLDFGLYELKITVTMQAVPQLTSSASAFVRINPSGITANLVPLGTSIITSGHQKNLTFDPGAYSVDPDAQAFNASVSHHALGTNETCSLSLLSRTGTMPTIVDPMISISPPPLCPCNRSITSISTVSSIAQVCNKTDRLRLPLTLILYLGNGPSIQYHLSASSRSSMTILSGSLTPHTTYQFVVLMVNRRNATLQATGFVLVKVEDTRPQLIAVG